jgi:hypothetical protein
MRGSVLRLVPVMAAGLVAVLAGCGATPTPPGTGESASLNLSLTTVPTIRSVTVTTTDKQFGNCIHGSAADNTASRAGQLGFPNGKCYLGKPGPGGRYPITITNTGIASDIFVSASSADPADGGTGWSLCNRGTKPVVLCTGDSDHLRPGIDQYLLQNFSLDQRADYGGLSGDPTCDYVFDVSRGCVAPEGAFQTEGLELTGPESSSDTSTKWTITITWMPVPK